MITPKSPPQAMTPKPEAEREDIAERQADEPVADEVPQHRRARIAEAAQHAGGDALNAVEQLKHRGDGEQATPMQRAPLVAGEGADDQRARITNDAAAQA